MFIARADLLGNLCCVPDFCSELQIIVILKSPQCISMFRGVQSPATGRWGIKSTISLLGVHDQTIVSWTYGVKIALVLISNYCLSKNNSKKEPAKIYIFSGLFQMVLIGLGAILGHVLATPLDLSQEESGRISDGKTFPDDHDVIGIELRGQRLSKARCLKRLKRSHARFMKCMKKGKTIFRSS